MAYKQVLFADAVCHLAAVVAVNEFKPLLMGQGVDYGWDKMDALHHIQAYLRRCINAGAIPTRRWPLFGIEPAPLAPVQGGLMQIEDPGLMVAIDDFREWVKRSGVEAPDTWAEALRDSVQWNEKPIECTQVVTGTPKGRGRQIPENVQEEANEEAENLRKLNGRRPTEKQVIGKLATRFGVSDTTVKGRFSIKECPAYKNSLMK